MGDTLISAIGPAYRNWLYRGFYDSLARGAQVPFEVIFVGPNPPIEPMPDNFKYIQTDAKPAQCAEIAARSADGEYLTFFCDDYTFSSGFLNKASEYIPRLDRDKVLISFRFWVQGAKKFGDDGLMLDHSLIDSFIMGAAGLFRKDIWTEMGGLDRRFHGTFCDLDMQMRFMEYGMNPFVTPDCWTDEQTVNPARDTKKNLYGIHGASARKLLNSLWVKDGKISKNRLSPVQSFSDEEIGL